MSVKVRAKSKKHETQWEWNFPLLIKTLCTMGGLSVVVSSLYFWQSSSIASELLAQAKNSQERGENIERVKWLTRYVRLVPSDVESIADLAFAVDLQETGPKQNVELARTRLSAALVACGEDPQFEELRKRLRRKLIPRLLQYGSNRAAEAEQQSQLLSADVNDAEVMEWLAQSILIQRTVSEFQVRDANKYEKDVDFWNWFASQPTAQALLMAAEANPDNVDLAASLLSVCNQRPAWFGTDASAFPKEKIRGIADRILEQLSVRKDDGHAQFVVYANTVITDRAKANSILENAIEPAMTRLGEFLDESGVKDASAADSQHSKHEAEKPVKEYVAFWDWQIALERAGLTDAAEAEKLCKRLVELASEKVSGNQREAAYLRLASLRIDNGKFEDVIQICQSGLSSNAQSSALKRMIAFANLRLGRIEAANKLINEIESDAEQRLRQLDGAIGSGMTSTEKAEVRQEVATVQWSARLLNGQLAIAEQDYQKASKILRDAFKTTMSIASENRVEAGLLLAQCYSQLEQWDLAGQVYDECSLLRTSDKSISVRAIRAWRQAGSSERASEQIGSLDSGSFVEALERALLIASQIEKRGLSAAIKTARERLDAVPTEARSSLEPWRLELLELRFESVEGKEPKEDSLSKLEAIAERYPDVAEVQSLAALDLAALGRSDSSNLAINRIEQIAERTKAVSDKQTLVLTKANVLLAKKDNDGALQLLKNAIQERPEQSLKFAKAAAQIEIQENRFANAYEVIRSVPKENLDFEAIVLLAGIVDSLKTADAAKADELVKKIDVWITKLKKGEGEEGTNWRYLAAEQLIAQISAEANTKQLLEKASSLYLEIDRLRPHWGLASALGAKIASLNRKPDEAIALWRRAIRDGDGRISTTLDLMRELNLVNRGAEAEAEMQRVARYASSIVPVSRWAVSFAMKRGDFAEALARAEQLTNSKPEDIDGWVLRAQTSLEASLAIGIDEKKQVELRDAAWSYLDKAHSLSFRKSISVWDARFRFKLALNDKSGASAILEELLKESSLSDEVRFVEAGRRYLVLKEYGLARNCFDSCLLINPRSVEAHLSLADLYTAIGDTEEAIKSLRNANQAAPKNQLIRDRLAINLAFSKNEKSENFEAEIDKLFENALLPSTPRSMLIKALIDLSKGDSERQVKAVKSLRELTQSSGPERDDAKRLLANYFAAQWLENIRDNRPESANENFESAQRLYEEILLEATINPIDAARYVSLLINMGINERKKQPDSDVEYFASAEREIEKLETSNGSSRITLELRLRLAKARGDDASLGTIAEKWVEGAGELESLGEQNLWEITGQTLLQFGHPDVAISWLERLYEQDAEKYGLLAIALARGKKIESAIELCVKAYQANPSPTSARLIAEIAMMQTDVKLAESASQILKEAPAKFADSADLLDAVGTWYLMQRMLVQAVNFYEMAENLDPNRVRTLNNLAMALSEMPMRKQESLAKIEKAIGIYGRQPDLLDTLGQVQYRNGRLQDGVATLLEAIKGKEEDVAFKIHLAQVLMAKEDFLAAKEQWTKIKQSKLEDVVLTPEERQVVTDLNSQFGEKL